MLQKETGIIKLNNLKIQFLLVEMFLFKKAKDTEFSENDQDICDADENMQVENPEEKVEDSSEYSLFDNPIESSIWYVTPDNPVRVEYHSIFARQIIGYLNVWCFNRRIDNEHKDKIKASIKKSRHLMGTIQAVCDKNSNIRIVNGQHRLKAIEEIFIDDSNFDFDIKIFLEVYRLPDIDLENFNEDFSIVEKIFELANDTLNIKPKDDKEIFCRNIVSRMRRDEILSRGINDKEKPNRPYVSAKSLYEDLLKYLPPTNDMTDEQVVLRIKKINSELRNMSHDTLFGPQRKQEREKSLVHRKRTEKLKFYLNMNCLYPPEVWISTRIVQS